MLQYDYKELAERALATRSEVDCQALAYWFEIYGRDCWNGEEYDLSDVDGKPTGYYRLRPEYKWNGDELALDENDEPILLRWEIV